MFMLQPSYRTKHSDRGALTLRQTPSSEYPTTPLQRVEHEGLNMKGDKWKTLRENLNSNFREKREEENKVEFLREIPKQTLK